MTGPELRDQLERHHADAFAWARSCCRDDPDEAAEVLQSVYLMILDARATFSGHSSFRTWLFGVIRLTALNRRRGEWARLLLLRRNGYRVLPDQPPAADRDATAADRASRLRSALATLADRQREVIELVFYHGLTLDEAAGVMRVSAGSTRTHYARAKDRLATLLAPLRGEGEA